MKIILSPSKTQDFSNIDILDSTKPIFKENAIELVYHLKNLSKKELAIGLKIKNKILDNTYDIYQNFEDNISNKAILAYSGQVFKQLNIGEYDKEELKYLQNHICILSALYGVLRPFDKIKPYRLDMTCKIFQDKSLYDYWNNNIKEFFHEEDYIINLASKEFSKLIKKPLINIEFKEKKEDGAYKVIGMYAKTARGKMLDYIVKNKITNTNMLKDFKELNYKFNEKISTKDTFVFTR